MFNVRRTYLVKRHTAIDKTIPLNVGTVTREPRLTDRARGWKKGLYSLVVPNMQGKVMVASGATRKNNEEQ